ncbi:MAG TPA: phosphatidylglycerol lysyltransferase domain-containing protein [Methanothrix sp.]|nr:phosphatidylglycerol lysyltransferase domain-containing protein [Methanothrix sp.]
MLSATSFQPVSLMDREFFARHYAAYPQLHSDNTFTNMVCWNNYAHYRYAYLDGCLLISSTIAGKTRYRPPIGPQNPELLADLLHLASQSEDDIPFVILDPDSLKWISELYPELQFYAERNYFDYVYLASDLAELPGKKYLTIRHQLNKFQKTCQPQVEMIGEGNIGEVAEFLELWCDWKDCDSDPVLAGEKLAVDYALTHFRELGLSGLAIRAEGKIGAISLFEGLNSDTALVHFEKGLPDCKGIYRAVNAETARTLAGKFTYINRESDMGVEGIREAKMRYHPHHMIEVHMLKREELVEVL